MAIRGATSGIASSWTIAIAAGALGLSAATVWTNMTNRTTDQITALDHRVSELDSRVATAEGSIRNHDQRIDKSEKWIGWLVQRGQK